MYHYFHTKIKKSLGANFVAILVTLLSFNLALPPAYAQVISNLPLPEPGQLVEFSKPYQPVVLRAITINQKDPLLFDFIVERGDSALEGEALDIEVQKLVKYFLTALTMKDDEVWVNLSPYEKDQMIPSAFGVTEMGKDLLVEDYMLKQITASLTHPDSEVGKKFWQKVYDKAYKLYGTTQIPINTFSKVWVLPDKSVVLEKEGSAFVVESHLKVMLEEDYLAIKKNLNNREIGTDRLDQAKVEYINSLSAEIVKEIVLPELEKEVNTGENFALARQVYNSAVLAAWYKKRLRETLLGKLYIDQNKVAGVDADDLDSGEKVYDQYMEALRAGVYNMVKQDYDLASQNTVQRRYFSGGFKGIQNQKVETVAVRVGYLDLLSEKQKGVVNTTIAKINNPTPGKEEYIQYTFAAQKVAPQKSAEINNAIVGKGTDGRKLLGDMVAGKILRGDMAMLGTVDFAMLTRPVESRAMTINDKTVRVGKEIGEKAAVEVHTALPEIMKNQVREIVQGDTTAFDEGTGRLTVTPGILESPKQQLAKIAPVRFDSTKMEQFDVSTPITIDDVVRVVEDRSRRGEDKENPIDIPEFRKQLELVAKAPDILTVENEEKLKQVAPIVDRLLARSDFRAELARLTGVTSVPERRSTLMNNLANANLDEKQWNTLLKSAGFSNIDNTKREQIARAFKKISDSPELKERVRHGDITVLRELLINPGGVSREDAYRIREKDFQTLGGIDLSAERMDLKIERDGDGVPLPVQMQDIQNIKIEGLYPVIMNVAPATPESLPFLSSSLDDAQQPALADSKVN